MDYFLKNQVSPGELQMMPRAELETATTVPTLPRLPAQPQTPQQDQAPTLQTASQELQAQMRQMLGLRPGQKIRLDPDKAADFAQNLMAATTDIYQSRLASYTQRSYSPRDAQQMDDEIEKKTYQLAMDLTKQADSRRASFADETARGRLQLDQDQAAKGIAPGQGSDPYLKNIDPDSLRGKQAISKLKESIEEGAKKLMEQPEYKDRTTKWLGLRSEDPDTIKAIKSEARRQIARERGLEEFLNPEDLEAAPATSIPPPSKANQPTTPAQPVTPAHPGQARIDSPSTTTSGGMSDEEFRKIGADLQARLGKVAGQ